MTPPSSIDDTLDPNGNDPDAVLLRAMRSAASEVQPDPAFRDQLWADLLARLTTSQPVSVAARQSRSRDEGTPMRPIPRMATTGHRWTSPIATIAAALVIALIGYGALSLSGATPTGINLDLNEMPNASAQGQTNGQGRTDHPVVGTWAYFDLTNTPESSNNPPASQIWTLDSGGGLAISSTDPWSGQGTWTSESNEVTFRFTILFPSPEWDAIDGSPTFDDGEQSYIPHIAVYEGSFRVSSDQNRWEAFSIRVTTMVRDDSGPEDEAPPRIFALTGLPGSDHPSTGRFEVQRVETLTEQVPTISAEKAGFGSPASPQPMPDEEATVSVQATQTADTGQPSSPSPTVLIPTEQPASAAPTPTEPPTATIDVPTPTQGPTATPQPLPTSTSTP